MNFKRFLAAILLVSLMAFGFASASAQHKQEDVYDYEWYLSPAPRQEGKAYLAFWCDESPLLLTHNPQDDGMPYFWDIYYSYEEQGGVDFTVERVTEVFFNEENEVRDVFAASGIGCSFFCRDITIKAGEMGGANMLRPVSSDTGYGVAVSGTDANGNKLTFGFYVPLSQEVRKTYTVEDVTKEAIKEERKAFMSLTPTQDPAPLLVASEDFDGGNGWFYGFEMHNETEVPFTPSELIEICFFEGQMAGMHSISAETLVEWGSPSTYSKDLSWTMTGGMPEQDVTGVGYVLHGTDANGNELEFCTYIELERK